MPEARDRPTRRSPFQTVIEDPANADLSDNRGRPGIHLRARPGLACVQIDCRADRAEHIDLPLPGPGAAVSYKVVSGGAVRLLNLGPARWLAVGPDNGESEGGGTLEAEIRAVAEPAGAVIVDQTHGRAILRVSGPAVRAILAKGTGIDLHSRAMAVDTVALTALFHIAVTIDRRRGPATFDIHMPRSYAQSLLERLIEAAREVGGRWRQVER